MTAVVAVKQWSLFLYRIAPPAPPTCEPSQTPVVTNPDGSFTSTYVSATCVRSVVTTFPDTSFRVVIHYPGGPREEQAAKASDFLFPPNQVARTFTVTHRFNNGNRAEYVIRRELQPLFPGFAILTAEHYRGSFFTKGRRIRFSLDRTYGEDPKPDDFRATLPGGTRIALLIPFDPINHTPDFSQPAKGQITVAGRAFSFALSASQPETDRRWDALDVGGTGPWKANELHGSFRLHAAFSGRGQMYAGSALAFVAAWDSRARATLVSSNGHATSAGPARGALDLLALRWSGLASANGPQPGL
jgi:ribosomal protein L28